MRSLPFRHAAPALQPDARSMEPFGHACAETSWSDAHSTSTAEDRFAERRASLLFCYACPLRSALHRFALRLRICLLSRNLAVTRWRHHAELWGQLRRALLRHQGADRRTRWWVGCSQGRGSLDRLGFAAPAPGRTFPPLLSRRHP